MVLIKTGVGWPSVLQLGNKINAFFLDIHVGNDISEFCPGFKFCEK